ncbi:MAG: murein biosynthesis integral membrane protein MurJ [Cellvibrionaceae bacterium]
MTEASAQPQSSESASKSPRLLRSSAVVGSMTMLSRVLGLVRDIVFARFLGAEANADAFFVAFKIPNFLRRLFAEGAFAQAFVPVLSEYRERGSEAAVRELINRVAGALGFVVLMVSLLAVVVAPWLAAVFAPGWALNDPVKLALTGDMIRVTFPYLFFISMTGFAAGILNSYDRFAVPAFTPVLLNVCLIAAAIVASPLFEDPAFALAWGVFAAGVVQFLFQLPFLARIHMLPKPVWDWQHEGVRRILKLMAPAIFGVSVSQINLLLDTVLASFLPTGSVSWLYYSDRLVELPLGVFAIAVATVILPNLSRQYSSEDGEQFTKTLDWALRMIFLIALPAAVALILLAEPILFTLFQYGELQSRDVTMAAFSLRAYALGLLAFMLIKVLAPGYFARQDTKTPVKIGIVAMAANMVLNVVLVVPLYVYFNLGHAGLALATALSAFLNAGLLYRGLRRENVFRWQSGWGVFSARLVVAVISMSAVVLLLLPEAQAWLGWGWQERSLRLALVCVAGAAVYGVVLLLGGLRPRHLHP